MIGKTLIASIALGAAASAAAQDFERPYWLDRGVIEALGRSELHAAADTATFSATFREVASNARDASLAASDRARLAAAAMRDRGGGAIEIASSADIEALHQEYRLRDGERVASDRADRIDNYAVSVTLRVTVRDVARAGEVRAAAMAVGPEEASGIEYSLQENAPGRLRAYRAAVEDAAQRARAAAAASGATLGALMVLQEGQGPCLGRWQQGAVRDRDLVQNAPTASPGGGEIIVTGSSRRALRLSAEDIARMQLPEDAPSVRLMAQVCAVYAVG